MMQLTPHGAKSVDPDQTAPKEQSDQSTLFAILPTVLLFLKIINLFRFKEIEGNILLPCPNFIQILGFSLEAKGDVP